MGAAARFTNPQGVATDGSGNVYVADTGNNIIRKVTPAGVVTTLAGQAGTSGSVDGTGMAASFRSPQGLASDSSGNLSVADTDNFTIRRVTPSAGVTTLAGQTGTSGSVDGTGMAARFAGPRWVATDSSGNVYVVDTGNDTIRKVTPEGVVTTLAGQAGMSGSVDGVGTAARFNYPSGVATDSSGNVYVADTGNNTIRKVTPEGVVTTLVGTAGLDGFVEGALPGRISAPMGVAVRGSTLYFTTANGIAIVTGLP